jgi:anthranilate phosphoribosyltransferase
VVLNAAAGLWVAGAEANPHDCAALAAQAIDSGAAGQLLDQLAKLSQA